MIRQLILAFGLLALVLAARPASAQELRQAGAEASREDRSAAKAATANADTNRTILLDQVVPHQAAQAGASAHDEEKPNILAPDLILGISTLIVFLVLLLVLWKYAWGPLQKALHDREEALERTLEETERARHEAERLLAEHRKQMEQASNEIRALMDKAHRDAEATAADILRKAQAEAEAARQRAERDIANARDQALVEIWSKASDLAVSVAGRVLSKQLGDEDRRRLVEAAIQELPDRPAANGHGGHSA
jgi:F-type H+-transporting ATPase subunit b